MTKPKRRLKRDDLYKQIKKRLNLPSEGVTPERYAYFSNIELRSILANLDNKEKEAATCKTRTH